jgi:hypothetical protein
MQTAPRQMVAMNVELMGAWHEDVARQMAAMAGRMEARGLGWGLGWGVGVNGG